MSKNTRTRILLVAVASLLLVTMAVGGTIAWLQDKTTPVTNTFTTSNVDITLTETTGSEYKMVPGATINKDPVVNVVANSEACWIFVVIDEKNNVYDATQNPATKWVSYTVESPWALVDDETNVYYIQVSAADATAGKAYPVIKTVTVNSNITNAEMAAKTDKPEITFTAYAVQQEQFDTAKKAWTEAETNATTYPAVVTP